MVDFLVLIRVYWQAGGDIKSQLKAPPNTQYSLCTISTFQLAAIQIPLLLDRVAFHFYGR